MMRVVISLDPINNQWHVCCDVSDGKTRLQFDRHARGSEDIPAIREEAIRILRARMAEYGISEDDLIEISTAPTQ